MNNFNQNMNMGQDNQNNMKNNNMNNINIQSMNYQRTKHKPNLGGSIISVCAQESQTIDKNETNTIKNIIQVAYSNSENSQNFLSDLITQEIKQKLGGEWFVFICNANQNISLNISTISDTDYLIFKLGTSIFKIAKIK